MKLCAIVWTLLALGGLLRAQERESGAGLVGLHQALLDARTTGVVLNIAAHPDDESSRTNAILRRKFGWRVVTVYSTYGDGGQNAIGREIGPELAALRVRETLRAAALSDVEVRWLGMPDFGFSKTLEETLQVWDRELLLRRLRAELDRLEPDLVLTNHSLDQGHGHHRASFWAISELLRERAAQGRRVPPLFSRAAPEQAQWTVDPAELEPARGETYAALAHRAWVQHVSQGPWSPHDPLLVGKDHWRLVDADLARPEAPEAPFEPLRWLTARQLPSTAAVPVATAERAALATAVGEALRAARAAYEAWFEAAPGVAPPPPARVAALRWRIDALQRAWLALHGVRCELRLERDEVPFGGAGKVFVVVHGQEHVADLSVVCDGNQATAAQVVVRTSFADGPPVQGDGTAPATVTVPGRLEVPFTAVAEPVADAGPEPAFAAVVFAGRVAGLPIELLVDLPYTPVPPVEIAWDREVVMVPEGTAVERLLSCTVTSHRSRDTVGPVRLSMGPGLSAVAIPGRLTLSQEHHQARLLVRAKIDANELGPDPGFTLGFRDETARLAVRTVAVVVPPGLRVGLVRGPDDTTERALLDLGVPVVALDRDGLALARLEDYSTLLLDIRAYHHRPELAELRDRLLQFVAAGGRVVAMYHKSGEWNERAGHPLLAPFPLVVGNERATEEAAPVVRLEPGHRLWTFPHPLTDADFAGWVQERGLNFASRWDPAWVPLLELRDTGDAKPMQGALLHTRYGQGDFVYCGLALYRQLRLGHAGAARLLVNLLAK
jgi:LmbE family N-acetylglucosaminyl deacetylase